MEYGKLPISLASYFLLVAALLVANNYAEVFAEASMEGSSTVHRRQRIGVKVLRFE